MTNFVKQQRDAIAAFQGEMDRFGLKVDNGSSGHYVNFETENAYYRMCMRTDSVRAKGRKALIQEIEAAGYHVNTMTQREADGTRYTVFFVTKYTNIHVDESSAEEYREPKKAAEVKARADLLKAMNTIVKDFNNEEAYMTWIYLIPDEADDEELEEIAQEDEESFKEACVLFKKLMAKYAKDGFYVGGNVTY